VSVSSGRVLGAESSTASPHPFGKPLVLWPRDKGLRAGSRTLIAPDLDVSHDRGIFVPDESARSVTERCPTLPLPPVAAMLPTPAPLSDPSAPWPSIPNQFCPTGHLVSLGLCGRTAQRALGTGCLRPGTDGTNAKGSSGMDSRAGIVQ